MFSTSPYIEVLWRSETFAVLAVEMMVTTKQDDVFGHHGPLATTGETMMTGGNQSPLTEGATIQTIAQVKEAARGTTLILGMNSHDNNGSEKAITTTLMTTMVGVLPGPNPGEGRDRTTLTMTMDGAIRVIAREGSSVAVVAAEAVEEVAAEAGVVVEVEAAGPTAEEETFRETTVVGTATLEKARRTMTQQQHHAP